MPNTETIDTGTERFKKWAKKITDKLDDLESRVDKLEKGGKNEMLTYGIENGTTALFWVPARRDWDVAP